MNATQNVQVLSSFCQPQKNFRQQRGHQRAVAVKDRLFFLKKNIAVNGVEHQQTVNIKKWENSLYGFQKN